MFSSDARVLVADDFPPMRRILLSALLALGLDRVDEAGDGEEAWAKILLALGEQDPYTLLISDGAMPRVSGLELLRRLRAQRSTQGLPVILVTSDADPRARFEAEHAGVSAFVTKPFDPSRFREALKTAFQTHAA